MSPWYRIALKFALPAIEEALGLVQQHAAAGNQDATHQGVQIIAGIAQQAVAAGAMVVNGAVTASPPISPGPAPIESK